MIFGNPAKALLASGRIVAIRHPELGEIRKIDTRGLDYTITLADGTALLVNAEEDPGKLYEGTPGAWVESERGVSQWCFEVDFDSLSELHEETKAAEPS